jgi:hypothetical protein
MERRIFLFGGIAGLISMRSRLAVDDPFLKDLRKERRGVGHAIPGVKLQPEFDVTGWQLNIEEDDHTLFDFVITNYGPKDVRVAHCQPFTTGPWVILERLSVGGVVINKEIKHRWRCCNASNFFFIEINTSGSIWTPIGAENSKGALSDRKEVAHIAWFEPQEVRFEIRGRKGAEEGHC